MNLFRRISSIIIPTVYDNALSYMEMVRKLGDKINDVIEWINNTKFVNSINGKTGNVKLSKLTFSGYSAGTYDGSENLHIRIPTGVGPNELGTLKVVKHDGTHTDYDGSDTVEIPAGGVESVNGKTGVVVLDADDVNAISTDYINNGIKNPMALRIITGNTYLDYDGSQNVQITIPTGGGGQGGSVISVNGKTGVVVLNANEVHALPDTISTLPNPQALTIFDPNTGATTYYDGSENKFISLPQVYGGAGGGGVTSVNGQTGAVQVTPENIGALSNAYISTGIKNPNPLTITIDGTTSQVYDGSSPVSISLTTGGGGSLSPVTSVNGKTGAVEITLSELGGVSTSGKLPNPNVINFSGYYTAQYDGSQQANVQIPNKVIAETPNTQSVSSSASQAYINVTRGVNIFTIESLTRIPSISIPTGITLIAAFGTGESSQVYILNAPSTGSARVPITSWSGSGSASATFTTTALTLGL